MWQLLIFLKIIAGNVAGPILIKRTVDNSHISRFKNFIFWLFFFCLFFSIVFLIGSTGIKISRFAFVLEPSSLIIIIIGSLISFATYCQWLAFKISVSKFAIFSQGYAVVALFLGYLFLKETQFITAGLLTGIILCFIAAALLLLKNKGEMFRRADAVLLGLMVIYSIFVGLSVFFTRYFALEKMPFSEFLASWYFGSFLGAILIIFASSIFMQHEEKVIRLNKKELLIILLLAFISWITRFLDYGVARLAPITVFQPIFSISEVALFLLVGLIVFKERKGLTAKEKFALLMGLAGVVFIVISYR